MGARLSGSIYMWLYLAAKALLPSGQFHENEAVGRVKKIKNTATNLVNLKAMERFI
jgi:hypothetical protein